MLDNPLVSVIIVVKDGDHYLDNAIQSVLNQTYANYEIILIDGGSTDKTSIIARSYSQIRYCLQDSQGIANAYNQGIELAQGELVAFLSHDDLWTHDKLETQVVYMVSHPQIEYTVTKVKFFLENGQSLPSGFRAELLVGSHVGKIMETLLAKKSLFNKIGNLNPEFSVAEDVDWFARVQDARISMSTIDKVLLHKRVHNTNLSLNSPENTKNLLKIIRKSIKSKREF